MKRGPGADILVVPSPISLQLERPQSDSAGKEHTQQCCSLAQWVACRAANVPSRSKVHGVRSWHTNDAAANTHIVLFMACSNTLNGCVASGVDFPVETYCFKRTSSRNQTFYDDSGSHECETWQQRFVEARTMVAFVNTPSPAALCFKPDLQHST